MDDRWRDSYDAWKLATPPEYEPDDEELEEAEAEEDRAVAVGQERCCTGCKFWSELIAQSIGCGPVEALCLNDAAPSHGKMVSAGCSQYEYGEPIDLRF